MRRVDGNELIRLVVAGNKASAVCQALRSELIAPWLSIDADSDDLRTADVILIVADTARSAREGNASAFRQLFTALAASHMSLGSTSHLFATLPAQGLARLTSVSQEDTLVALGAGPGAAVSLDLSAKDMGGTLLPALERVIAIGRREGRILLDDVRDAERVRFRQQLTRRALRAHYSAFFVEENDEYTRSGHGVTVFEYKPTESRPFWTYATAGLTVTRGMELVAYSAERNMSAAEGLSTMGLMLEGDWANESFGAYETCDLSGLNTLPVVSRFILAPCTEAPPVSSFEQTQFFELFPVSAVDMGRAIEQGSPSVLSEADASRPAARSAWSAQPS